MYFLEYNYYDHKRTKRTRVRRKKSRTTNIEPGSQKHIAL